MSRKGSPPDEHAKAGELSVEAETELELEAEDGSELDKLEEEDEPEFDGLAA